MFTFGNLMLALALGSGSSALAAYALWGFGDRHYRRAARLGLLGLAVFVLAAAAMHLGNITTHQFGVEYVTNFSDRSLPPLLLISTFWAGQAGSLMLWAVWSVIFGGVLALKLRRSAWEPFVMAPYLLVAVTVTALTLASGPFRRLETAPADGNGLNPLLQNYWMAIHPPILFTGFTTMAGPFAFAVAALWKRDVDGWVRFARPWIILAWACLGTGLALGGFWAYESLGWGGFWGWDPVENSSLVPWLFASALLHGLIVQRSRGTFRRANLALAIVGYLMVLYSTFLTRSGILGQFSVHSFVELGLMGYLVLCIVMFAALGLGLLAWRWRSIGQRVLYERVVSREFGLVVAVSLGVTIALIVGIGTSMPVITLLPVFASQASVDLEWYGPVVAPFGLLVVLAMGVGPLLGWRRTQYGSLTRAMRWPALAAAVAVFGCLLLNIIYPVALLFVAAAVFAVGTNAVMILRIWRAGPLKIGGYLSHVGIGLLFLGIVGTGYYKETAALQLIQDTPQSVFGRQWTFRGTAVPDDDVLRRNALAVEVTDPRSGRTWNAYAPYYNAKNGQQVTHPDIESGLWSDLYLAPSQYLPAPQREPGVLQLIPGRTQLIDGYAFTFREFALPNREAMLAGSGPIVVQALIDVQTPDGSTLTIRPALTVDGTSNPRGDAVAVPGGASATLEQVDPASRIATVKIGGVDLSGIAPEELKARAFVEVSREPGIKLVWLGIMLAVVGGLLALVRRAREAGAPAASGQPLSEPVARTPVPQPAMLVSHEEAS